MSDILTPTSDQDVGRLALIEAVRANTDAVNRMARHGEKQDTKLDAITAALAKIDTRLSLIEQDNVRDDVRDLDERVKRLETEREQRQGGKAFLDGIVKYGPMSLALLGCFVVFLVLTGKVVL